MKMKCKHVDVSEAGEEIYQASFEVDRNRENSPYVLIQRAFFEEEDGEPSPIYLETHDSNTIGHYPMLDTELSRNRFVVRLPPPISEIIEVEFKATDKQFVKIRDILSIILQKDLEGNEDAQGPRQ